jgi:endonuclease/exonuclease/phosphatase family metal-dependent hydrolase
VPVGGVDYKRSLHSEFAALLARFDWDVALLQEAPPRWFQELAFRSGAQGRVLKTSRNQFGPLRGWIADRAPDLIKSNEGGSNQILFRPPLTIAEERDLTLARIPERRRMLWLRLLDPTGVSLCVANLHASAKNAPRAAHELLDAARAAVEWSNGRPLILGGDFNVRPRDEPSVYEQLAADGFSAPTGDGLIDHLLLRGGGVAEAARQLPAERREVAAADAARVRLSDHAVVVAAFDLG